MPPIFDMPKRCPKEVERPLRKSFSSFWSDPRAAASSTRVALERLLDAMGVPAKKRGKTGFKKLTIHARIEALQKINRTIGDQLMAVKWLGNTGSHEEKISHDDLLDAYEIMEHALEELINQRSKRVAALAKSLSKKHAPKK